jgi:hypothetical protein
MDRVHTDPVLFQLVLQAAEAEDDSYFDEISNTLRLQGDSHDDQYHYT